MQRFIRERNTSYLRNVIISVLIFLLIFAGFGCGLTAMNKKMDQEEMQTLQNAITRSVTTCYTLEGSARCQYHARHYYYQEGGGSPLRFQRQKNHVIDLLFPIAVLFVFAISSFLVLVLSAHIYSSQTQKMNTGYTVHTSLAYVAEKIRQNDSDGGISAGTFQGQECLVLKGGSGDIRYTTYIYSYKGKLKELTLRDGTDASPSDGKDILAVADFSVSEIKPGLFRFTSTDTDGTTASVTISERSRQ